MEDWDKVIPFDSESDFKAPEIPEPTIEQLQESVGACLIELIDRCIGLDELFEGGGPDMLWIVECATWLKGAMERLQAMVAEYQDNMQDGLLEYD